MQDANDTQLLLTMIEETEISTGSEGKSKKIFADSGYASANNFEQVEDKEHLDVYVPARELVNRSKNPLLSAYID